MSVHKIRWILITGIVYASLFSKNALAANQLIDTAKTNLREEFFVQTLGNGFTGLFDKLTVKVNDVVALYPSNISLKEWSNVNYRATSYVRQVTPCSYTTTPKCSGSNCNAGAWDHSTEYTITLDFTCRSFSFTDANYYAVGFHGGNAGNDFRIVGSLADTYANGALKTGTTNVAADCYYGSNSTWGGWGYNQVSDQTSVCHGDTNVSDAYFIFGEPDVTPPTVTHSINPLSPNGSNSFYITIPTVQLTSADSDLSKIEYIWDSSGGTWNTYTSGISPAEGTHTLYYKATDLVGNVSTNQSVLIRVDTTNPDINYTVQPNTPDGTNLWYVTGPKITLSSTSLDVDKIIYYWNDEVSEPQDYSSEIVFAEGTQKITFKTQDMAGNYSEEKTVTLKTDTKKPQLLHTQAEYNENHKHVDITWKTDDEDIKNIKIYKSSPNEKDRDIKEKIAILDEGKKYVDEKVSQGDIYYYKVEISDDAGNSDISGYLEVKIPKPVWIQSIINFVSTKKVSGEKTSALDNVLNRFKETKETTAETPNNQKDTEIINYNENTKNTKKPFLYWIILLIILLVLGVFFAFKRYKNKKQKLKLKHRVTDQ